MYVCVCICDFFGAMVRVLEHCVPWSVGAVRVCMYMCVCVYVIFFGFGAKVQFVEHCASWSVGVVCVCMYVCV